MNDKPEILTREEVLGLLSQKAREGTTSAMIALEGRCDLRPTPASTTTSWNDCCARTSRESVYSRSPAGSRVKASLRR